MDKAFYVSSVHPWPAFLCGQLVQFICGRRSSNEMSQGAQLFELVGLKEAHWFIMSSRGKEAQELVHWFIMLSKGKRAKSFS